MDEEFEGELYQEPEFMDDIETFTDDEDFEDEPEYEDDDNYMSEDEYREYLAERQSAYDDQWGDAVEFPSFANY